jgi:hypothetical protein
VRRWGRCRSARVRPSGSSPKRSRLETDRCAGSKGRCGTGRKCTITSLRSSAIALPVRSRKLVPDQRQLSSSSATSAKVSVRWSGVTPSSSTCAGMSLLPTRPARYRARRVRVGEGLSALVPGPLQHRVAQVLTGPPPLRNRPGKVQQFCDARSAVQRHLAQPRRLREHPALAAHLPDALIGKAPGIHRQVGQGSQPRPEVLVETTASADPLVGAVQHLAVDVVLSLIGGAIATAKPSLANACRQRET